jgi:hypothetical protein
MSSWLLSLRLSGVIRPCPIFGGDKPKIKGSGSRRMGADDREQRLMDVKMDVEGNRANSL